MLDTLAVYPYDKTIGKLTFKFDPKNAVSDVTMEGFRGEGKSEMGMSNSYYDGNFPEEYRQPIFMNDNPAKKYRVKFRLKGEFRYYTEHWYTDYIYMMLSASFLPYPPAVSEDVFLCKSNEAFAELNTAERLYTLMCNMIVGICLLLNYISIFCEPYRTEGVREGFFEY